MKEKICVVLTGGTICSVPDKNQKNYSDANTTSTHLTEYYHNSSNSPFRNDVTFDIRALEPDILSENMTASAWNGILEIFKNKINYVDYKGIIVLHGTDTLAYTSAFLSFALAGINIPVCMVSAQLRLGQSGKNNEWEREERTNGYANFRAAVELIMNGIAPNVYAVYRNEANEHNGEHEAGDFFVHYGAHLLQCPNASNNFHSRDQMLIPDITNAKLEGKAFESNACLYKHVSEIKDDVLMIRPYTNLNYRRIDLEGVKTVIHGTYHSESVCIGRAKDTYKDDKKYYSLEEITDVDQPYSILYLLKVCKNANIPVFLAPCNKSSAAYGTTENALSEGALNIANITLEAAYAKAVLGCALKKSGSEMDTFMNTGINYELVRDGK